ncbi:nucleoside hydrolase [bacterium]|nr:nucleoside hydrolase [bacterium]
MTLIHLWSILLVLAAEPVDVWLDVDTANGVGDVDDGLMMIQCFHSPEIAVRGVSVLFGNASLDQAMPIAREICRKFGPAGIEPQAGSSSAEDRGQPTDAVKALAKELERRPLVILAVGPATNIATLLATRPDLGPRITKLIMVAGRRPKQRFVTSPRQWQPHPDANFEKDVEGMRVILASSVPLVLAPWEVSSHVWLSRADLERMRNISPSGEWIARTSQYWLTLWEASIDERGFNPFDTLAAGYVTHPDLIESMNVRVEIVEDLDDRALPKEKAQGKTKHYMLVHEAGDSGREAIYCYRPKAAFHDLLVDRLAGTHVVVPPAPSKKP